MKTLEELAKAIVRNRNRKLRELAEEIVLNRTPEEQRAAEQRRLAKET